MMGLHILMTGGTGLIGTKLLDAFTKKHQVTVLYREARQDLPNTKWIHSDLENFDPAVLDDIKGVDVLVHNAGCTKQGTTNEEKGKIRRINIDATSRLFDWAESKEVQKIIFTGSMSVLKKPLPAVITEGAATGPEHIYGESKLFAEEKLLAMNEKGKKNHVILRVSSPMADSFRVLPDTVFKKWINSSIQMNDIEVYGTGDRTQDFVSVNDIANAFLLAAENQAAKGIFNIASGTSISMTNLAKMITAKFGNMISYVGEDESGGDRWNISVEKAKEVLGFQPQYVSEENVKNLLSTII